jgi:hypothetical protein
MKSELVDSKSLLLLKLDDVNGEKTLFKSFMGWRKFGLKSFPELNASNALRRRLLDDAEDDDEADEDDKGEKLGCVSDWDCCCC